MFPPSGGFNLDVEAISGICGSISIACWVVVFSPQIIENFRRSSAEGLSIEFIIIWLAGDVFNIIGAVLQGVLPTMIILAIYYTFADIVLLIQCFYYRGFTLRDPRPDKVEDAEGQLPTERSPLIANGHANGEPTPRQPKAADTDPSSRTRSQSSFRERFTSLDGSHLSPAHPMHPQPKDAPATATPNPSPPRTWPQALLFNTTAILLVILAGIAGYYLSPTPTPSTSTHGPTPADQQAHALTLDLWGQISGYTCAVLYLGSRVPQLLLNYRRKSTEGLNALFFLFACLGNLTYVLSIFAFAPICRARSHGHWHEAVCADGEARSLYGRYILVNASWLIGSAGTLVLDLAVFAQFWVYREREAAPRRPDGEGRGRDVNER